jgi:hypothetical protein
VFLGRYPVEPTASALLEFYRSFLPALADPTFRHGHWQLCDRSGWPGDDRYQNLVAWCWEGEARWLIVVNLSDGTAAGLVRTPWADLRGRQWHLIDPRGTSLLCVPVMILWMDCSSNLRPGTGTCSASIRLTSNVPG